MMRRYSRPRTLMPGWTRPRPSRVRAARVRLAYGLTTMPSPPAAVGQAEMPAMITFVVDGAVGGEHLERGQPHPVQAVHRPAVVPVGGGERFGVGGPGGGPPGEGGHV